MTPEFKSHTELDVWKEARKLVVNIYALTKSFPKEEQYGLVSQMRRCAVSVPSNIAEGCGRNHKKDSTQFFYIARGSLYELETQLLEYRFKLYFARPIRASHASSCHCSKLLNGFIRYFSV